MHIFEGTKVEIISVSPESPKRRVSGERSGDGSRGKLEVKIDAVMVMVEVGDSHMFGSGGLAHNRGWCWDRQPRQHDRHVDLIKTGRKRKKREREREYTHQMLPYIMWIYMRRKGWRPNLQYWHRNG